MRKTAATAVLLAVLTAMATLPAPAADDAVRSGVFAPLTTPNPEPVVVSSIDPVTAAEGTASIVTNPELLTPIVTPAPVAAPMASAPAAGTAAPAAAAAQDGRQVMSFAVPVPIPADMAYPPRQQRYPQQYQQPYQQQLQAQQQQQYQRQLAEQAAYQRQQYEEQLRLRQEYELQRQYAQQQYAARQQELAQQQQQLQQQLQDLSLQQRQLAAQADAIRQEALILQQQSPVAPAYIPPYALVRQFDPNAPVPPQPPMAQPYAPAPQYAAPAPAPQYTPPAAQPLPAADFVNTLRHPSTGGDKPVLSLITPAEVKQALNQGVRLVMLDVRDGLVRDVEGIIPGSVSVPFEPAATFVPRVERVLPRGGNYPVVVFCSDGIWSAKAAEVLAREGYSVYVMGAYRLWVDYRPALASLQNYCTTCP